MELLEIELFDHLTVSKQMTECLIDLLVIHSNTWKNLTYVNKPYISQIYE